MMMEAIEVFKRNVNLDEAESKHEKLKMKRKQILATDSK